MMTKNEIKKPWLKRLFYNGMELKVWKGKKCAYVKNEMVT